MATAKKVAAENLPVKSERSAMELMAVKNANLQEVVAGDVIVPKLLLMQAISPAVVGRKAQIADMVRSLTGEKLGDPEHPVWLVPLAIQNTWIDFETAISAKTTSPAFRGTYPRGVTKRDANGMPIETNKDLPWKFTGKNGEEMFRRQAILLYALLPQDVVAFEKELSRAIEAGEVPDLNKGVSPVVITFQSTSFKHGGKKIATFFNNIKKTNVEMKGKMTVAPFDYMLSLSCREEKKGAQSWYVFDFGNPVALSKAAANPEESQAVKDKAAFWVNALAAGTVRVDDDAGVEDEGLGGASASHVELDV